MGSAVVPPPDPGTLLSQIPDRPLTEEEAQFVTESQQSEAANRAEVQRMLGELRTQAESEKAAILSEIEIQKAQVMAAAEAQTAAVQAVVENQVATIRGNFATSRAALLSYAEQQKGNVDSQIASDIARIEEASATRISSVDAQLSQRQTDMTAYAEEQRQQPPIIARQESDRADRELESAAVEAERMGQNEAARYPGGESPAPEKRAAVIDLSRETAADIRAKKPAIAEDMQSRASDFTGQYMEYAQTINGRIEEARGSLIPELENAAASAVAAIESGREAAFRGIDARVQVDTQALDAAEAQAVESVSAAGERTKQDIAQSAQQAAGEIEAAGAAMITQIDNSVMEVEAVVSDVETPFLPGIADVIEGGRATVLDIGNTGRQQLVESGNTVHESLNVFQASFSEQASQLTGATAESARATEASSRSAIEQVLQSRNTSATGIIDGLATQQQQLIDQVLAEVDQAILQARGEVVAINTRFQDELRPAVDESIAEAKKPLTDPLLDRLREVARTAGNILLGVIQAIGDILVGFLILIAVALVVFLIGLAFGVILSAWTVMMIAGALLLAFGFVRALMIRSAEQPNAGTGQIILLALGDATGVVPLYEGITGRDIVTGRTLDTTERTRRGVVGAFSIIMLVLGVRAAVKGPPGGIYYRPLRVTKPPAGGGGTLPPPEVVPPEIPPERPPEPPRRVPVEEQPPRPYDPRGRSDAELLLDRDPTPRHGETPEQAAERVRLAEEEILERLTRPYDPTSRSDAELLLDQDPTPRPGETPDSAARRVRLATEEIELRRQLSIIEGLGEEPREVDVRADDGTHRGRGAHTVDRHGADIPLEMPRDAAGNRLPVPTGVKTIEGRIFGDTGWGRAENNSFRWKSDGIMNRTVNEFIRANWTRIKEALAERGEHSENFNAEGGAVGEGFFDPNQTLPGPRPTEAVFMETSLVRITIRLIPGPPPDFFIVTTFPNALGAPVR